MSLMQGKRGIIFGMSNKWGIAYGIAKTLAEHGAEVALSYAGEALESRVKPIGEELGSKLVLQCDVTDESQIESVFNTLQETYGTIDFVVHAVAFANREDLDGNFSAVTCKGWDTAMHVSAYSLIPIARHAQKLMPQGGSIMALTYLGGERSVPFYNIMGVAKAALDATIRYLAAEFGPEGIRVNGISAGPLKTLAAKGIHGFDTLLKVTEIRSPLKRNITLQEVGNAGLYFASDLSSAVTGEIHHVDCGMHSVALTQEDAYIVEWRKAQL